MFDKLPTAWLIDQGRRLHLQEGPIDVIIEAAGRPASIGKAYSAAAASFEGLLSSLVEEIALLRRPLVNAPIPPMRNRPHAHGAVAQRMIDAAWPFANFDVTPMIAVAGAVADHLLAAMRPVAGLERLLVNNGGDIALYLGPDGACRIGVCANPQTASLTATVQLESGDGVGGVATSGWRGRSHSLGVADAVTVLAPNAAVADAAATLVANAVDVPGSPRIRRVPARELDPESDLGYREVTVDVAALTPGERRSALAAGVACARMLSACGSLFACYLSVQGEMRVVDKRGRDWEQELGAFAVPATNWS